MSDSLFQELKRRNVFKVGVAYLVLAWVVIQVAQAAVPALHLPDWINTAVFFFGLVGFPFALFFAWAFEVTPDGVKHETEITPEESITAHTGRKLDFIIIGLLVIALGYFVYQNRFNNESPQTKTFTPNAPITTVNQGINPQGSSIAVLPFVNMSNDASNGYFSDGISEEILNVLAKIPNLHVTSRSSAFQFRGDKIHIPTVAAQLGVANVLEGSVRKDGKRVRVTAQLIDAESDKHLWSETYDRELTDIFAIQDEISTAIVDALKTHLGIKLEKGVALQKTASIAPELYEEYLLAKQLLQQKQKQDYEKAIARLKTVLVYAADYAPAHVTIADAYSQLSNFDVDHIDLAHWHLDRALKLSPEMSEALAIKGTLAARNGQRDKALEYFEKSLQLNPNQADTHNSLSVLLFDKFNRYEEGVEANHRAVMLDPLNSEVRQDYAISMLWIGRVAEAEEQLEKLKSLSKFHYMGLLNSYNTRTGKKLENLKAEILNRDIRKNTVNHNELWQYLAQLGLTDEALSGDATNKTFLKVLNGDYSDYVAELTRKLRKNPQNSSLQANLGGTYVNSGNYIEGLKTLEKLWLRQNKVIEFNGIFNDDMALSLLVARLKTGDTKGADIMYQQLMEFEDYNIKAKARIKFFESSYAVAKLLMGDMDAGLISLEKAVDEGWFEPMYASYLNDFSDQPRFKAILAKMEDNKHKVRDDYLTWICAMPDHDLAFSSEKSCAPYLSK